LNVLITGSSRGLGRSLAYAFAEKHNSITLHGRDRKRLTEILSDLQSNGRVVDWVIGDLTDVSTIGELQVAARKYEADILINNAGLYNGTARDIISVNLMAPILLTRAIYPLMVRRGSGLIVNINSLAGKTFNDSEAVYCASKWGLRGFMGSFKYEARKHGVNVLDVYLGAMKTDATKGRPGWENFIDPDDAARQIVALCGDGKGLAVTEVEMVRAGK